MQRRRIGIAALLVAAAVALYFTCFSHEVAWRVAAADRPWVERALRRGAAEIGSSPEAYRAHTRPRVWRLAGQICIDLRPATVNEGGTFVACYSGRDGRLVSQRAVVCDFGGGGLLDSVRDWLW